MNRPLTALQFWSLSGTAGLALVLVLINISLFMSNRSVQTDVNSRQHYINESIKINRLSNQLIQSIANLSAQTKDDKLRALLATHGIEFAETSPPLAAKDAP